MILIWMFWACGGPPRSRSGRDYFGKEAGRLSGRGCRGAAFSLVGHDGWKSGVVRFFVQGAEELAAHAVGAHENVVREIRVLVVPWIEE